MPTTKTGYWIRVVNGEVKDVWDYKPADNIISSQAGWREAVEVFPDTTPYREIITSHSFNLEVEPAQIVWDKRSLSIEERKDNLAGQAKARFARIVEQQKERQVNDNPDESYDAAVVDTAKTELEAKVTAINACATHEELDAHVQK